MINSQFICKSHKEFFRFASILTVYRFSPPDKIVADCNYFFTLKYHGAVCDLRRGKPKGNTVRISENLQLRHPAPVKSL